MKLSSKADEEERRQNGRNFWNSGLPDMTHGRRVLRIPLERRFWEEAAFTCMLFQFGLTDTHAHTHINAGLSYDRPRGAHSSINTVMKGQQTARGVTVVKFKSREKSCGGYFFFAAKSAATLHLRRPSNPLATTPQTAPPTACPPSNWFPSILGGGSGSTDVLTVLIGPGIVNRRLHKAPTRTPRRWTRKEETTAAHAIDCQEGAGEKGSDGDRSKWQNKALGRRVVKASPRRTSPTPTGATRKTETRMGLGARGAVVC